jgi:predicted metal-dependent enzyme (double-stranded beta helix superfamily)
MTTPLDQFIMDLRDLTTASDRPTDEELALTVADLLQELVVQRDPIPEQYMQRSELHDGRGRYMLHRAPTFTVSSVVWAPGEVAPPHTHETWGAIGLISNAIEERRYEVRENDTVRPVDHQRHTPGATSVLIPDDDVHSMHNLTKTETVEIHVYGKDLTGLRRKRWSLEGDDMREFASGKYFNC